MKVTLDTLEAMRERQALLVDELHAGRDDPGGSPILAIPASVQGSRVALEEDAYIGLGPAAPAPGPVARFAFARPRRLRGDRDAVPALHHLFENAVGGLDERSREAARRVARFAELKIEAVDRAPAARAARGRGMSMG